MTNVPVVICIGTNKVMGDALGPFVGDLLHQKNLNAYVYGCSDKPVNGVNIIDYLEFIERMHPKSLIIAVDASVGRLEDIGRIKTTLDGIRVGGALNKNLPVVGHIGIIGIVAERGKDNLKSLIKVPYSRILEMSMVVAKKVERLISDWNEAMTPTQNLSTSSNSLLAI